MANDEKKTYYEIVSKAWQAFAKERSCPEFSSEWWDQVLVDMDNIKESYQCTDFLDFACQITFAMQEEHERRQKNAKKVQH